MSHPRATLSLVALTLAAAAACQRSAAAQQPETWQLYRLSHVLNPDTSDLAVWPATVPLHHALGADDEADERVGVIEWPTLTQLAIDFSTVEELLRLVWGDRGGEAKDQGGQGPLHVRGDARVHERTRAFLQALEYHCASRIAVEIHMLPADAPPVVASASLSASEASRILDRSRGQKILRSTVPVGGTKLLRVGKLYRFLADYATEVATKAMIADPRVNALHHGLLCRVGVHRSPDGRLCALFAGRRTDVHQPMPVRKIEVEQLGNLHLPRIHTSVFCGSGLVEDGGALLVGSPEQPGAIWLIRLHELEPAVPERPELPAFVPVGPLVRTAQRRLSDPGLRPPGVDDDEASPEEEIEPVPACMDAEALVAHVGAALEEQAVEERVHLRCVGDQLVVFGSPSYKQAVRRVIGSLTTRLQRSVAIHLRSGLVDAEIARGVVAGKLSASEVAGQLPMQAATSALLGDQFRITVGTEHAFLRDFNVEIAEGAKTVDPIVGTVFAGTNLDGVVTKLVDGRFNLAVTFRHSELPEKPEIFKTEADLVGNPELPTLPYARADEVLRFAPGDSWKILRVAPSSSDSKKSLVALVKLVADQAPPERKKR